jgi:hypothetical protein
MIGGAFRRIRQLIRRITLLSSRRADAEWVILCSREQFEPLRTDPAFHRLIDLARHVNALRLGQAALFVHGDDDDSPSASRQRSATFLYHAGILFEALDLIPQLRTHFGDLDFWESTFGVFGDDQAIAGLRAKGTDLQKLRNHASFHVLPIVAQRSLARLEMDEYVFASGRGRTVGDIYYNLADTVPIHYVVGAPREREKFLAEFERMATEVRDLVLKFLEAADRFIPRVLRRYGFKRRNESR